MNDFIKNVENGKPLDYNELVYEEIHCVSGIIKKYFRGIYFIINNIILGVPKV